MLHLRSICGVIKMALRLGDQAILSDLPNLVAADAHRMTSPTRPSIGTGKSPVIHNTVALQQNVV
jgi:hypothetical protein